MMALNLFCLVTCLVGSVPTSASTTARLEYNVEEEVLAYTFVGDVASDSRISQLYNQSVLDQLQFTVLPRTDNRKSAHDLFTVGRKDGIIRVRSRIDRDQLCPRQEVCAINLDVAIHGPPDVFRIVKVRVRIIDANDNAPTFPTDHVTRQIPENTKTGTTFSMPAAEDPDSPRNGVTRYEITDDSGTFALKVTNGSDSSLDVYLVLMKTVDRESQRSHRVIVTATDGGAPTRTGSMTIDVVVLDVNDNHPTFERARYEVDVPEDRQTGSTLITVRATDRDSGQFGEIVYGFSDKTSRLYGELFAIDATNGTITMSRRLDYETRADYALVATASERRGDSIPAETAVRVRVRDVNDNAPAIAVNALAPHGGVRVRESAAVGSFLAYVSVVDADSGDNGEVTCRLADDAALFGLRTLFPGEFKLETTAPLDREQVAEYDVTMTCHDRGTPPLTTTAVINVSVLDVNDNAPRFTKAIYSAFVLENNAVGASIAHVTATDADAGANGVVSYQIRGIAQRYVDVDSATGEITAKVSFDHEHLSSLRAVVVASDNSSVQPRTSSAVLKLTILDVNDESPMFAKQLFQFVVLENLESGTKVGHVSAADADSAPYKTFTFSFAAPVAEFSIDTNSGEIFTRQLLDRENQSLYEFVVIATDRHTTALSGSARVRVIVGDVNDNAPVVEFPVPRNCTVNVSPRSRIGHEVALVVASDSDIGDNARLTYSTLQFSRFFEIDMDTGAVFVQRHLAEIVDQTVTLYVLVEDAGKPPRSTEVTLNVVVSSSDIARSSSLVNERGLVIAAPVAMVTILLAVLVVVAMVTMRRRATRRKKVEGLKKFFGNQTIVLKEGGNGRGKTGELDKDTSWDQQLPQNHSWEVHSDNVRMTAPYSISTERDVHTAGKGHYFDVDVTDEIPQPASEYVCLPQTLTWSRGGDSAAPSGEMSNDDSGQGTYESSRPSSLLAARETGTHIRGFEGGHCYWRQPSVMAACDQPTHQTDFLVPQAAVYTSCVHSRPNTHDLHNCNGQTLVKTPRPRVRVPSPFRVIPTSGRCGDKAECSFLRDDNYMDMTRATLTTTRGEQVFCHARSSHV